MAFVFPRRWTPETEAEVQRETEAWDRAHESLTAYHGNGAWQPETILSAIHIHPYDGSIVVRMHTMNWTTLPLSCQRAVRVVAYKGQRALDLSECLPELNRACYVVADDRIPRDRALILTDDGKELVRVRL